MNRTFCLGRLASLTALTASLALAGCSANVSRSGGLPPSPEPDLAESVSFVDDGGTVYGSDDSGTTGGGLGDPCGDVSTDPNCQSSAEGPPNNTFPLQSDANKNPLENDNGVNRDVNGYLLLDSTHSVFNYVWIANTSDLNVGTASKIDSKTVREVARYYTTTCFSLKGASTAACDGTKGCCSIDDWQRYQARKNKMKEPGHQGVQFQTANYPSRTSVDFNGDLFISNRAFGTQSSITKIANDQAECIDRNHNGKIDTSKDSNGDGAIQVDCNGDGQPDDIAGVKAKACTNKMPQEFYGQDDECVLWTSNTFVNSATGRPLGLAAGANDANVSDAWAGSYDLGIFVRVDGTTGLDKDDTQLPGGCNPYGLAVDAQGIGWSPDLGGPSLCFFDTKNTKNVGVARNPGWGQGGGYGITLDRDQNVWVASDLKRYTPDRSNGFKNLANGWWTGVTGGGGIGVAADSRTAKDYYVWSCNGNSVLQVPASTIKVVKMDQQIAPMGWPSVTMPCYGVGVDADQNVWGVNMGTSTRALVDAKGKITQPSVNGPVKGNNICPAGDSCANSGAYTYSDFTGFGLRNFTRPQGSYSMVIKGCADGGGAPIDTQWFQMQWEADVPPNTTLIVHAKSGNSLMLSDPSWMANSFTTDATTSPVNLQDSLSPNLTPRTMGQVVNDPYLYIEFILKTQVQNATPRLKSFEVGFKCNSIG